MLLYKTGSEVSHNRIEVWSILRQSGQDNTGENAMFFPLMKQSPYFYMRLGFQKNPHLRMWVPGNLPPNLVFLLSVTKPSAATIWDDKGGVSHSSDAVAADAPDEAAHLEDTNGRQHPVDG